MHNHFAVKFLALVLTVLLLCTCAVTGIGILALNESGLYRQSVEEAYLEQLRQYAQDYGTDILNRSLSQDLGGADPQMTEAFYGPDRDYSVFRWNRVGYILRDETGQAIEYRELPQGEQPKLRFSIPAEGTYLKIHGIAEPEEDSTVPAPADESPERSYAIVAREYMILDSIPAGGAEVHSIALSYSDSSEGISSPEGLGTLIRNPEGRAVFTGSGTLLELSDRAVTHVVFENRELGVIYEASCLTGVGIFYDDGTGNTVFEALVAAPQSQDSGEDAFSQESRPGAGDTASTGSFPTTIRSPAGKLWLITPWNPCRNTPWRWFWRTMPSGTSTAGCFCGCSTPMRTGCCRCWA